MSRRFFKVKKVIINPEFSFYIDSIINLVEKNIKNKKVVFDIEQFLAKIEDIATYWNEEAQTAEEKFYKDADGVKVQKIDHKFFKTLQELGRLFALESETQEAEEYKFERLTKCVKALHKCYYEKQLREMTLLNELWHAGLYDYEKEEVIKDK